MSQYKLAEIADTVYFWFALNDTTGTAADGATPLYDVRLAGAASSAAPTASGTPTLLSHADYANGVHEIAINTTGYSAGEYAVFCTATVSTVNPSGFVGSFKLRTAGTAAFNVNTTHWNGTSVASARPTVDIDTIKTQSVTCNAGVTVGAYVGGTGAAALASEVTPARMGALTDLIDDGRLDVILDTVAANVAGLGGAAMRGTDNAATAGAQMDLVNAPNATAVTAIQNGLATPTNITAGTITTVTNLTNAPTNGDLTATMKASVTAAVGLGAANLDAQLAAIVGYIDTEIASILTDTSTNLDAKLDAIKSVTDALTAAAATKLAVSAGTMETGTAVAGTLSTTEMTTDLSETVNDHWAGRIIIFTSGTLAKEATNITAYDGATKKLTFTGITSAPAEGVTFIIV